MIRNVVIHITNEQPLMADAVSFKYIAAPLSKDQLARLILVPLR